MFVVFLTCQSIVGKIEEKIENKTNLAKVYNASKRSHNIYLGKAASGTEKVFYSIGPWRMCSFVTGDLEDRLRE